MSKRFATLLILLLIPAAAAAHFGVTLPSTDIVMAGDNRTLNVQVKFIHPTEGHYMEMEQPRRFGVLVRGQSHDLLPTLSATRGRGAEQQKDFHFWSADYTIQRPGDHTFFVEPAPYWEAAEDLFIVHYTKVCVHALGLEQGWNEPVGLETEIVPLTRPYGLWSGNLFSGQVLLKGKPAPHASVEVEYLNERAVGGTIHPPSAPYVTQVVTADGNGIFHYALPKAGWWGFSALSEADWTLKHDGVEKAVEIGAVYWVQARDID
ncbi:MAG: DUF4198 domain-containing protein [Desulfuromonadaceae bacterium]|nr:DUF4198 domain-containing protein [Desulfuromonadaceae bacterium]